ncbi:MAG: BLUF domain-containing protein [Sphingomonadales bacterium]|nr:BLUF domain-containing protein [Sphingomonadales bacterium]
MLSVIYVSVADPLIRDEDIAAMLTSARRNNARDDLTGALIYNGNNFMQLLEGEASRVDKCLNAIRNDTRHSGMTEVRRRTIETRDFADWFMLYYPGFDGYDENLGRLAGNGPINAEDERMMSNFIALGQRRPVM